MTLIRLDSATLTKIRDCGSGPVIFGDETGTPQLKCVVSPAVGCHGEPIRSDEECEEIANDPVEYSLEEVWMNIRNEMEGRLQGSPSRLRSYLA